MPKETEKFDRVYKELAQLVLDTGKAVGSVTCRTIEGVEVSFTRTTSTYLKFEIAVVGRRMIMNLYDSAKYIAADPDE